MIFNTTRGTLKEQHNIFGSIEMDFLLINLLILYKYNLRVINSMVTIKTHIHKKPSISHGNKCKIVQE